MIVPRCARMARAQPDEGDEWSGNVPSPASQFAPGASHLSTHQDILPNLSAVLSSEKLKLSRECVQRMQGQEAKPAGEHPWTAHFTARPPGRGKRMVDAGDPIT